MTPSSYPSSNLNLPPHLHSQTNGQTNTHAHGHTYFNGSPAMPGASTGAAGASGAAFTPSHPHANIQQITDQVRQASHWIKPLQQEIGKVIIGQKYMVDRLIVALLSDGHVLLEGVPGLAKTLTLRTLASCIQGLFRRIQFTPDLLPADIVGTEIFNPRESNFNVKHGPIFAHILLADEINRAPAKVQSALLEGMQERQVTIGEQTYPLPEPFFVMATQNPIEQEGTYPLPEAQLDRFMLKVVVTYPTREEERMVLDLMGQTGKKMEVSPIISTETILESRKIVNTIYIDDKVKDYIVSLVHATREPGAYRLDLKDYILHGASPRATISLTIASRALAFMQGRGYVTPQDVKSIAMDILRHRVSVTYEAEAEGLRSEDMIRRILDNIPVP